MGITSWLKNIGSNTLYYPGCLTKGILKQELGNYKDIFNKLGIDFIMLPEEVCCGLPVLNGGYRKEAKELARKNLDIFKKYNIKKIITNCPSCFHMFHQTYPQLLRGWDIKVEHATITILHELRKQKIRIDGEEPVTYHDPCHLGRYSGIYDEPREVISLLGGKVIEMKCNKENALCCGGGGGVRANFPELAKNIARARTKQAPSEAEKIISPCGLCFSNLKSADERSEEFSSWVLRKLNQAKRW
jgi:Fe-S oxidoreductase